MTRHRKYNAEQLEFIRQNQEGITRQALADLLKEKYGIITSANSLKAYCKRLGLKNGLTGHFEKGCTPPLKGTKGIGKRNSGCFEKGIVPHNTKPIGYEYVASNGYIIVKVGKRQYRQKQRVVWEQINGAIPNTHCIKFIDGNTQNCDIDNLMLVPKSIIATIGRQGITDNIELNKAIILTEHLKFAARSKVKC